jgi:HSP20 family molecular chaperone IbpA
MAPSDSVWYPHTVSFNSKHFKGPHHGQMHHFHFPPVGLQSMARKFSYHRDKCSHTGGEPRLSSWTPNTDIRETKLVYHIEIEVPGVMDRQSLLIQWMSPRTLLVEGDIKRPPIGRGKNAEGETLWEQEGEDWSTEARKPQEVRTNEGQIFAGLEWKKKKKNEIQLLKEGHIGSGNRSRREAPKNAFGRLDRLAHFFMR